MEHSQSQVKSQSAIIVGLGAFRSTPIKNLLLEANICPIEHKRDFLTGKLAKNLLKSIDTPLKKLTKSTKRHHRYSSTIDRVIQSSKSKLIPYLPIKNNKCKTFNMDSIIKATSTTYLNTINIQHHQPFSINSFAPSNPRTPTITSSIPTAPNLAA